MSVITHNGKVAVAENGDALSFDDLIALANQKTGQNNKTLAEVVDNIPSGSGGGVPLDPQSSVDFAIGYDDGGLYIVTDEEDEDNG